MKQIVIALIAAAVVVATFAVVTAEQYDTCQAINRQNLAKCVLDNAPRGGE